MGPVEHDAQEAILVRTLREHPHAIVSAVDDLGRLVELPTSLELFGQDVVRAHSWTELVAAGSHFTVIDVWEQAMLLGAAMAPVALVNGREAAMHVVDVRQRHGVLVGMLVAESGVELLAALADRPVVVPKTGSVDKDATSVIRVRRRPDQPDPRLFGRSTSSACGRSTSSTPTSTSGPSTPGWRC